VDIRTAKQHGPVLAKSFHYAKQFLFANGVIALSGIVLEVRNWVAILHDNRANLLIRGISVDAESLL
jgi:phage I-like protein